MPDVTATSGGLSAAASAARAVEIQGGAPRARASAPAEDPAREPVPPLGAGILGSDRVEIQGGVQPVESGGDSESSFSGAEAPPRRSNQVVFNTDYATFQSAISVGDQEIARIPPDALLRVRQSVGEFVQNNFSAATPEDRVGDLLGQQVDEEG